MLDQAIDRLGEIVLWTLALSRSAKWIAETVQIVQDIRAKRRK